LGGYPRLSLADARDRAEQLLRDAAKGISPREREAEELREAQVERLNTFRAVAAAFIEDHAKNLRTRGEMQRVLNVDLLPAWGDRPIASITRRVLIAHCSLSCVTRSLFLCSRAMFKSSSERLPWVSIPRRFSSLLASATS
jgi:Arm DNA-binding domain